MPVHNVARLPRVQQRDPERFLENDHQIARVHDRGQDFLIGARIHPGAGVENKPDVGLLARRHSDGASVHSDADVWCREAARLVRERVQPRQRGDGRQNSQPPHQPADQPQAGHADGLLPAHDETHYPQDTPSDGPGQDGRQQRVTGQDRAVADQHPGGSGYRDGSRCGTGPAQQAEETRRLRRLIDAMRCHSRSRCQCGRPEVVVASRLLVRIDMRRRNEPWDSVADMDGPLLLVDQMVMMAA